jgi:hypothetical protein
MRGRTTGTKLLRAEEAQQSPTISLALSFGSPRRCSGSDDPERVLVTSVNPGPFGVSVGTSTMADLLAKVMLCPVFKVQSGRSLAASQLNTSLSFVFDPIALAPQIQSNDLKSS